MCKNNHPWVLSMWQSLMTMEFMPAHFMETKGEKERQSELSHLVF